jgi:hypothetical protein
MKNKSSFLSNCYEWLFSKEEQQPVAYIVVFSMIIVISVAISIFVVAVDRHVDGLILWMFK